MRSKRSSVSRLALSLGLAGTLVIPPSASADFAYVTNQSSSDLSIIDLERMVEVRRITVPGMPAGIAVCENLGKIFTVSPDSKTLRRFDLPPQEVEIERQLDGGPIGVAVDEQRRRIFVSDWYNARVWVLSAVTLSLEKTLETGSAPAGLAVSSDGRWLATADRDSDQVSIFDAETLDLAYRVDVGARPFAVAFAPDGRLFSADVGSDTVTAVDPQTGRVLGKVKTGQRPYGITFAEGRGFVTNQYDDSISVFDASTFATVAVIPVGGYPEGIDTTADGHRIVVANWDANTLSVIDARTLKVIGEVETGDGPRAFGRFLAGGTAAVPGAQDREP